VGLKDNWKDVVRTVAPVLGTALGGPLGGIAARTISSAILGTPDGSEDDIAAAVNAATPEQLVALKKADNDFQVEMRRLEVDLERIATQDRASARQREVQTKSFANPILAAIIIGGFFAVVAYVLTGSEILTGQTAGIIGTLIGYVSAKADMVATYYFGSSAGSARKTDLMSEMAKAGK
jgi:uncharacterized membrane protein